MLRRTGVSEEYLGALLDFRSAQFFDAPTVAALSLAEHMTDHPDSEVPDPLWQELRAHFSEGEVLELGAMIGLFHYTNRFNNAFDVEPTV